MRIVQKDRIFAEPLGHIEQFSFDERVAGVFDDMIERSVPGYRSIVAQTGILAGRFALPGTHCYDLGCSLGASTFAMRANLAKTACRLVAVDNSTAMLERMRERLRDDPVSVPAVEVRNADIASMPLEPCSVAVLNFTLQFVAPELRADFTVRLADAMVTGGALVLSEKIRFDDQAQQSLHVEMHEQFKRNNGYSELEISQKREALEDVMIPETLSTHRDRLHAAGFSSVEVWFQYYNFMSLVAIK